MGKPVLEVASYWGEDLFSLDYVREAPAIDPGLRVVTRWVDPAERLPGDRSGFGDLLSAIAVAIVLHAGLLGLGHWIHGVDPEDDPPSLRTLGTLAGNVELGGSEGSTPSGGVPSL